MTKQIMSNEKKGLAKWTTRDLLVTAVISLVFTILLLGVTYIFMMFIIPLGVLVVYAVIGVWAIPPIFVAYILRRPGASLLAQAMISLITVAFSPFGWMELSRIVTVALPIELVFWATRYRNYRLSILMLANIVAGLVGIALGWVPLEIKLLPIEMQIAVVVITIISGTLGAWLAKLLADAVAKTGVLSSYAVGQEHEEEI